MEEKTTGAAESVTENAESNKAMVEDTAKKADDLEESEKILENKEARGKRSGAGDRNRELEYFVSRVSNPDTRHYIQSRVVNEMEYYRTTCAKYKAQYLRFMTASIILGALIPVASIASDSATFMKFVIAALGSSVTAINAYLGLNNFRDLWFTYRDTRNTLLRTLYYYFNNTSSFEKISSQEEKDKQLIQMCEKILANENSAWISTMKE